MKASIKFDSRIKHHLSTPFRFFSRPFWLMQQKNYSKKCAMQSTDLNILQTKIQQDQDLLSNWFSHFKLTVNAAKTKYMLNKPQCSVDAPNFHIEISNSTLQRVTSFTYLGQPIQENLKWDIHIDSICRKIMGISCVMNRLGSKVHTNARLALYYSMIQSHISYLIPVWGTSITLMEIARIQVAQNHAIRKFFYHDYHYGNLGSSEIKQKYNILNVQQLLKYNTLIMAYKIDKRMLKCSWSFTSAANHN